MLAKTIMQVTLTVIIISYFDSPVMKIDMWLIKFIKNVGRWVTKSVTDFPLLRKTETFLAPKKIRQTTSMQFKG